MASYSIRQSLGILGRTWPFILLRLIVVAISTMIALAFIGACSAAGYKIGGVAAESALPGAVFGAFCGFIAYCFILYALREYVFYLLKAAHIVVITNYLTKQPAPSGMAQIPYGIAIVRERLLESSAFFAIDQLVKSMISTAMSLLNGTILSGARGTLGQGVNAILNMAIGTIDELVLAYILKSNRLGAWEATEEALTYYVQNFKLMMKKATILALIMFALSALAYCAGLVAMAALIFAGNASLWSIGLSILPLIATWAFRRIILKPLALTCLMQIYFHLIENQEPDPDWRQRISRFSEKWTPNLG